MSDSLQIIEIIRKAGFTDRSYSGRGMFGRTCVGVSLDADSDFAKIIRAAGDCDTAADLFEARRTETLGHGVIVYWPDFPWMEVDESGLEPEYDTEDMDETE